MRQFYLLVDSKFLYCFLADKWIQAFNDHPNFCGILLREEFPGNSIIEQRKEFHKQYYGQKVLTDGMLKTLQRLYVDFGEESQNSIRLYGIPRNTFANAKKVIYLGQNLNGLFAKNWVEENLSATNAWVFSHVGQILKPWWVNFCGGQLLNMHSAVLPYARGANAVQNVAALKDSVALRKVAGASIHYIDAGVDTGNLIRAERIAEPFQYENLWQLIAAIYNLGDSMYVRLAQDLISNPDTNPVGFDVGQGSQGPIYLRKDFTAQKRQDAEQNFLEMRKEWLVAQRK